MKAFVKLPFPALALVVVGFATATAQVSPQTMKAECYERSNLLYSLATEHGERLDQTRRVGSNGLLEAFKNAADGTWTIVYSNDEGLSCVLATGDGLEADDTSTPHPEFSV